MRHSTGFTRKDMLKTLSALVLVGLGGAGQQTPARKIFHTKEEIAALNKISAYLDSIRTLKGGFIQVGPQGQVDQGTFYLQRPGKIRFEYRPPSPVLVVSDGSSVAVANRRLGTVDRYALAQTPFRFFLSDKTDLAHSDAVLGIEIHAGTATVRARTDRVRFKSDVAFLFSWPEPELRQWTVTDAQGLTTTVSLTAVMPGAKTDAAMFVLPKPTSPASPTKP